MGQTEASPASHFPPRVTTRACNQPTRENTAPPRLLRAQGRVPALLAWPSSLSALCSRPLWRGPGSDCLGQVASQRNILFFSD